MKKIIFSLLVLVLASFSSCVPAFSQPVNHEFVIHAARAIVGDDEPAYREQRWSKQNSPYNVKANRKLLLRTQGLNGMTGY